MRIILYIIITFILTAFTSAKKMSAVSDTSLQGTPLFSFGVVADVQYCDCPPADNRYYRASLSRLREALTLFRNQQVSFMVDLGDLTDNDFRSVGPVMNILDSSGIKVYHIAGNHDYYVDHRFKKEIPALKYNKKGYYSFSMNGFRMIFLNGNEVSTYSTNNKKINEAARKIIEDLNRAGETNGKTHNGALGADQLMWLQSQLDESAAAGEKVLIFCHFPVWPVNENNLLNYATVMSLLGNYSNVKAWFNGHNHKGNYGNFNMIHFVTLKGMVETENTNAFSVIEVYKNKIWIKGSGREKSQILAI